MSLKHFLYQSSCLHRIFLCDPCIYSPSLTLCQKLFCPPVNLSLCLSTCVFVCVCLASCLSACVFVCVCLGVCLVRLSPSVAWASVAYHEMNALFRPGFRCGVPTGWWLSPRPQAPAYLQLRLDGGHVPWLFHGKLHWGGELRQSGKKSRMELPLSFEKGSSVRVLNPAKFPVVTHN